MTTTQFTILLATNCALILASMYYLTRYVSRRLRQLHRYVFDHLYEHLGHVNKNLKEHLEDVNKYLLERLKDVEQNLGDTSPRMSTKVKCRDITVQNDTQDRPPGVSVKISKLKH